MNHSTSEFEALKCFGYELCQKVFNSFGKYLKNILAIQYRTENVRFHSVYGSSPKPERTFDDLFRWVIIGTLGVMIFVLVHNSKREQPEAKRFFPFKARLKCWCWHLLALSILTNQLSIVECRRLMDQFDLVEVTQDYRAWWIFAGLFTCAGISQPEFRPKINHTKHCSLVIYFPISNLIWCVVKSVWSFMLLDLMSLFRTEIIHVVPQNVCPSRRYAEFKKLVLITAVSLSKLNIILMELW